MRPSALAVLRLITSSYLVGCLHRKFGRLLAFEDAIDIAGRAPEPVERIRPVRDQAAAGDELAITVDRRATMTGRQRDDQVAMNDRQRLPTSRSGRRSARARRP